MAAEPHDTSTSEHRLQGLWMLGGWGLVIAVVVLSLIPLPAEPNPLPTDKLQHFIAYAALVLWFAQLYSKKHWRYIGLFFLALGVALEFLQDAMGYRVFSYGDILANSAGVLGGLGMAHAGFATVLTRLQAKYPFSD
jgi:hypothetical protein